MRGNPLAAVEDFDRARGDARPHLLAQQLVRHRVIVLVDLDVVIEPDPAFLPFGKDVRLGRQRLERRTLDLLEQRAAAGAEMARHAIVDLRHQLGDGRVQCREREELPVAQLGDDEAGRHLHRHLDLGLVAGPIRPRRHNGGVVMGRHLGVGSIDLRLVEAGLGDARAQIVGHHHRRDAADERKGARVRADPVGQALRPGGLGIGVIRRAEHGDEQLRRPRLAGRSVDHRERRAGVIDEQALAGDVVLPHGRRQPRLPGAVELAETAIAVAVGVDGAMLLPQQLQRHPWPAQLAVDCRPVRPRSTILGRRGRRIEPALQLFVRQPFRQRPGQAGTPRPPDAFPGGRRAHPEAGGDLAFGHAGGGQPQHVADFAHG